MWLLLCQHKETNATFTSCRMDERDETDLFFFTTFTSLENSRQLYDCRVDRVSFIKHVAATMKAF